MPPAAPHSLAGSCASLLLLVTSVGCGGAIRPEPIAVEVPGLQARAPIEASPPRAPGRPPPRNAADAPGALAFVETIDGDAWLVLGDAADEVLGSDPVLRSDPSKGFTVLEAKAKLGAIDDASRLESRSFDLYEGKTRLCTVRAGALRVLGVTATPFDLLENADEKGPFVTEELWTFARRYLAVQIDIPAACRRADWARLSELPEPRFAAGRESSPSPAKDQMELEFRAAAGWREAQSTFDEARAIGNTAHVGTWEEAGALLETTWTAPFAGASFTMRKAVWDEGCGATAGLTMVWRAAPEGTARIFEADDRFSVDLVLDLDGDGALEMIGHSIAGGRELRPFYGQDGDALRAYDVPEYGCSC